MLSWFNSHKFTFLLAAAAAGLGVSLAFGTWMALAVFLYLSLSLVWPVQAALGTFALLVPFDLVTVMGNGGEASRSLTWYAGAFAIVIVWGTGLVRGRLVRPPRAALWWTLFVAWGAASALWAIDPQATLEHLPTAVCLLLLYLATLSVRVTLQELRWVAALAMLGGLVASVFACSEFYRGTFFHLTTRASLIAGDRQVDPNMFAASLLLPLALVVSEITLPGGWLRKTIMLATGAVMALAIIATMSRGAVLAAVVMLLVFLWKSRLKSHFLIWTLTAGLGALLVLSLLLVRSQDVTSVRGSGRLDIWIASLVAVGRYGLIGAGLENFRPMFSEYAGYQPVFHGKYFMGAHNIYLQVLLELGIVGLLIMMAAITSQMRAVRQLRARGEKSSARNVLPYEAASWAMLVVGFFLGIIWLKAFWLSWILLAVATRAGVPVSERVPGRSYEITNHEELIRERCLV
jgi:O-antigen ligase